MRTVKLGLFGLGTVGGGVVKILKEHTDDIAKHQGVQLELVACTAKDLSEAENVGIPELYRTADEIFADPDIDIIIELIGGTGFALDVIRKALGAGKNVVTANKAIMAAYGEELFALAAEKGVSIAFEASCGGGIPIIGPLKHSLTANTISTVLGIVNGTTNYMLTRMDEDGMSYDDALKEAQANGFAEANPSADVDGFDAAAKIAILASIAFNSRVTIDDVPTEGITSIQPIDLSYAKSMGYSIKLLAIARRTPDGIDVRVHPTMIPLSHQLSNVGGVYNAIYVIGDAVGATMFFGAGAGSGAAASAVMGDVVEVARVIASGAAPLVGCTCTDKLPLRPISELHTKYYIRLNVVDQPGILAATAAAFAKNGVSIYSMVQYGSHEGANADLVYVTHEAREADFNASLSEIENLDAVNEIATIIRVEDQE